MAEETKAPSTSSPAPSGGNKLILILTLVNLIACIGIGAALFISHSKQNSKPSVSDLQSSDGDEADASAAAKADSKPQDSAQTKAAQAPSGRTMSLEQFTVNLATPGGTAQKFARVNVALELQSEESEREVQAKMPQVRNAIIDLFNAKRPNDLVSAEQREYLKEEIRNALNSFMTSGKVKSVYFTNFAVTG
jgi:flagellar FliL protein